MSLATLSFHWVEFFTSVKLKAWLCGLGKCHQGGVKVWNFKFGVNYPLKYCDVYITADWLPVYCKNNKPSTELQYPQCSLALATLLFLPSANYNLHNWVTSAFRMCWCFTAHLQLLDCRFVSGERKHCPTKTTPNLTNYPPLFILCKSHNAKMSQCSFRGGLVSRTMTVRREVTPQNQKLSQPAARFP